MKHSFEIAFFYLWRAENDNMLNISSLYECVTAFYMFSQDILIMFSKVQSGNILWLDEKQKTKHHFLIALNFNFLSCIDNLSKCAIHGIRDIISCVLNSGIFVFVHAGMKRVGFIIIPQLLTLSLMLLFYQSPYVVLVAQA